MGEQSAVRFLRTDDTNSVQGDVDVSLPFSCQQAGEAKTKGPVEAFLPATFGERPNAAGSESAKLSTGTMSLITTTTNSNKVEKDPSF